MQCTNCGYISFKQEKGCSSCGFIPKKADTSSSSLFRNDSFTIFLSPKTTEREQEETYTSSSQILQKIPIIESSESSQKNLKHKPEDFILNLSDAEQDYSGASLNSDFSRLENTESSHTEFREDITYNSQEAKKKVQEHKSAEFLLNLSDAEEDHSEPILKGVSSKTETADFSRMEFRVDADTGLQERDETISKKDVELDNAEKKVEVTLPLSKNMEQDIANPMAPVLDLGNTEILLDPKPESPTKDPTSSQLDKLEIDNNSDNTLFTEDIEQGIAEQMAPPLDLGNTEILLDLEPENNAESSPPSKS